MYFYFVSTGNAAISLHGSSTIKEFLITVTLTGTILEMFANQDLLHLKITDQTYTAQCFATKYNFLNNYC